LNVAFVALFFFFCLDIQAQAQKGYNIDGYVDSILKERKLKNIEFRTSEHSPIQSEEKAKFKHLNYYRPKTGYCREAKFVRFDQATHFLMKTTTDRLPEYSVYGKVTFSIHGKSFSLNVYQNIDLVKKPGFENYLFIPFNDETNGHETYGGGRFLDMIETGDSIIYIDFNRAYNPYCAYNHKYSCPIPPESNQLKTNIKAGEKKYH